MYSAAAARKNESLKHLKLLEFGCPLDDREAIACVAEVMTENQELRDERKYLHGVQMKPPSVLLTT